MGNGSIYNPTSQDHIQTSQADLESCLGSVHTDMSADDAFDDNVDSKTKLLGGSDSSTHSPLTAEDHRKLREISQRRESDAHAHTRWTFPTLRWRKREAKRHEIIKEKATCQRCSKKRRPLRLILRCLAMALMMLGLVEFVFAIMSLLSPSPDDERGFSISRRPRPDRPESHWPTDATADIRPIQCHSHNDYWRRVPLMSAIRAGCTGVEADVWYLEDRSTTDLFVGHSKSSLTPQRTFRSLYIDPLVTLLDKQNPNTTLHPILDNPRNGIFDTEPGQTVVLLVDFKTDGLELWPYVSEQLEPLREKKYLTYFNGTGVIEGPITVVATGNAPFNKVVESPRHRDIFFDAPLELLGQLGDTHEPEDRLNTRAAVHNAEAERQYLEEYSSLVDKRSPKELNVGQGHSGVAPKNPAVYTRANSYYASVSFARSIGWAFPRARQSQHERIRAQIRGAHKQGLYVRYWDTPGWPKGLRNYIWTMLVREGVDYLNVDDLHDATRGHWGGPRSPRHWSIF